MYLPILTVLRINLLYYRNADRKLVRAHVRVVFGQLYNNTPLCAYIR